jgi:hypothetical protein
MKAALFLVRPRVSTPLTPQGIKTGTAPAPNEATETLRGIVKSA